MEPYLKIAGWLLIALALFHIVIPRKFKWKEELAPLSLFNRQVMYVHTFFIAFVVLLMGMLCINSASEIIETHLGQKIALGLAIFWLLRLLFQFFVYSADLWKGRLQETVAHIIFSVLWIYLSGVFFVIYYYPVKA